MQYRKLKNGADISVLGFGCMRLPQAGGKIDMEETEREFLEAVNSGVNYFDTAYIYPGSEAAIGTIIKKNDLRDKIMIADKIPQYLITNPKGFDKYLNEELERLQTDYIDCLLLHMLNSVERFEKLVEFGLLDWIRKVKGEGKIRQLGFSFHGPSDTFQTLLDLYDWDFCQIQYNYMDEHSQGGRAGLEKAERLGIPVIIMEPLRGGRLVNFLPEASKKRIAEFPVKRSAAEWSFRWLWDQTGVTCILSGMNSMEMLEENIRSASQAQAHVMTKEELDLIGAIKEDIFATLKVNCTGCRYCMPCPKGVDIPQTFACYNHMYSEKKSSARMEYLMTTSFKKEASDYTKCIECGKCERHCPQGLKIREELKTAGKKLMPWYYKIFRKIVRIFMAR